MWTLLIDGVEARLPGSAANIGELLDQVDAGLGARGRIVTAVRLDGVDEPAFRDPAFTARNLGCVGLLEIVSGTPGELAMGCIGEVMTGLTAVSLSCHTIAAQFRAHDVQIANRDLATVVGSVASALAVIAGVVPYVTFDGGREALDAVITESTRHVEALTRAQAAGEWTAVADILESDLSPSLTAWIDLLGTATA